MDLINWSLSNKKSGFWGTCLSGRYVRSRLYEGRVGEVAKSKNSEDGNSCQSLTRLPVLIEAVGRAVSIETETINRNMDSITMKLTALLGDQNGQNGQRE